MRFKFASFFLVFALASNAQVPGYMGKKLTVAYDADMLPAFSPTAKSADGGINHTHSLNLEYTIRNRTNFCMSFRYFKTGISSISLSPNYYSPSDKLPMQLNAYGVGVGMKFFYHGCLAPIGKYVKPEVLLLFNNVKYQNNGFVKFTNSGTQNVTIGTGKWSAMDLGISYQIGRQRVFADKIIFDAGLRLGLMFRGFFTNVASIYVEGIEYNSNSLNGQLDWELKNRVFLHEIFGLHLGLGFLAY